MTKKPWILLVLLFFSLFSYSQESIEQEIDSSAIHSPKRAARLSMILPGAGQIYNHRAMPKGKKNAWWKVPIIYAGLGFSINTLITEHALQRDLKNEYIFRMDNGEPNPDFPDFAQFDDQGVLQLYEQHKGSRDMMIFLTAAIYGLNVLDALVEAHFVDFDVSPDLSLSIRPIAQDIRTPGISLALKFK